MKIASKYDPGSVEEKWYSYWMKNGFFRSEPDDREPYTIVIPPPNVTGVLHMGHMLNNTIQDILVRRARMLGYNTCWVPGTDHASIATEAKVVNKLKEEGIDKSLLTREEFLSHAWQWKEEHGGIILEQLKKLGASCDWKRTNFTMDNHYYDSVLDVFIDLYEKGLIYRGVRMVNWDPQALTAVSDEEVNYKEEQSALYYVNYRIEGTTNKYVTIATTRPETILGDTAVCVNPNDERYKHLHGKNVIVPMINRVVPIITDTYVDMEFGTGCLKITPAHDINDYEIGQKYNLKVIDIFNDDGTLSEKAELFIGTGRFEARKLSVDLLKKLQCLVKTEPYTNNIGYSERTDVVIEPKLSMQWFCKMKEIAVPALEAVMTDTVKFHPAKFKNVYRHWMEHIRDWCISRQLWWGQRIPVFYLPDNKMVAAKSAEEAIQKVLDQYGITVTATDLTQDPDVLDTWFSSWLWPMAVFDGIRDPDNKDIQYYYPTNDLVTAPEILFFWVARMIMAGYIYRNEIPFKNVYLTGIVRDKKGRKMSKQLGNSPDPIKLMDQYGADGVRVGMLLTSPAGNDLPFDEALCEQGRNFSNKIWNALRLIKGWKEDSNIPQPSYASTATNWFDNKLQQTIKTIDVLYENYKLSEALMAVYKLIWDDFCSWYLEIIKPAYQQPIDSNTLKTTTQFFETLMKVLHPFMPFISEEVWHHLKKRGENEDITIEKMPLAKRFDKTILEQFDHTAVIVNAIRNIRQEKNIPNKKHLTLLMKNNADDLPVYKSVITKLANLTAFETTDTIPEKVVSFVVKADEFFIPITEDVNYEEALEKLKKDLQYTKGFLKTIDSKLSNEKFINHAPQQVVDSEKKKRADAIARIAVLEKQINALQ
ncbi:MAG: valine--tRNA ligase [Bacteroidales bacterium]|nr:valine--tRNA ligase [Bacteroidales bacterium]